MAAPLPAAVVLALLAAVPARADEPVASFFVVRGGLPFAQGVKQSAQELASKESALGFSFNTKFNPQYWKLVDAKSGKWALRAREGENEDGPPVSASRAVYDVLAHPELYSIECATAIKFALYLAVVKNLGSAAFDAAAAKTPLEIGYGPYESLLGKVLKRGLNDAASAEFPGMASADCKPSPRCDGAADKRDDSAFVDAQLQAGDAVYVVNLRPTARAYQGENALFLGDARFFGHPFGVKTEPQIQQELAAYWDRGPADSTVPTKSGHVRNGPPGMVYDYYRADLGVLNLLGR